ncbi:hypothetical protein GR183_09735 [Stappia sp. GBMRC 2046]|uniref:Phasin protein n=1 Tax=Stappia sediminis TaxID=2692190 RepID=A0A7X3S7X5_9HYPH|nr:hypothetical protein [Stappia sediminis]MXN65189.1 hypothetical protein [Stappia sediminis]
MTNVSSGSNRMPETEIFNDMETWQPWNWAEAADRLEEMMTFGPAEAQRRAIDCAAALFNMQIDFVSKRLHADMDCALRMMDGASPADITGTASTFWERLVSDYEKHAEDLTACVSEHLSASDEDIDETGEISRESEATQETLRYTARRKARSSGRRTRARAA